MASESLVSQVTAAQEAIHKVTSKVAELGLGEKHFPERHHSYSGLAPCPSASRASWLLLLPWRAKSQSQFQEVHIRGKQVPRLNSQLVNHLEGQFQLVMLWSAPWGVVAPRAAEEVKHLDLLDETSYRVLVIFQLSLPVPALCQPQ